MIFATVGTQLPFPRLLLALDTWAALNQSVQVVAQTGRTSAIYGHMRTYPQMDQRRFAQTFEAARVVVAHAGMGTILTALETGKPLILMPRRAHLGEHRNDHQIDTAAEMAGLSNVTVVEDSQSLCTALNRAMALSQVPSGRGAAVAPSQLIEAVRSFIWADNSPRVRT